MNSPENRRLRTLVWGAIPVIVLGGALSIDRIPGTDIALTVPYAAEGPGPTVDTLSEVDGTEVVDVKAPKTYETSGQLNMTTVSVRTNMTLTQALGRWIMTDDTLVPIDTVIPQGQTDEEVNESNEQAFTQSESAATVAAMNYLDVPVKIVVAQVLEDAPAAGVVRADDVITSVDGEKVPQPGQVQDMVRAKKPGDEVELGIERGGKKLQEKVTLAAHPHDDSVALMGISMTSKPKEDIQVDYNLQDIGGPSAGMMFTLAVIDKLSDGELNGGKFVAGTGTISEDGTVGPIGGIVHKVAASKEAGAELFLAPADNCAEATSRDTGDMVVAKVETLDDAIKAMDDFAHGKQVQTCN
ncbi:signal protein PDZ [Corynebacterium sp. HMSC071F07]|uniref:YlbL family protein n=1 Tax=Corynebacterium sp. HMSC071F07 TaxID=1715203 RepID=UPI0008A442E2|nr:PDZ domain-containing protein [Corynebacterium sp. HMSC071F07]OFM02752.1 signal protein PDZ [Corynebacterium sp. HMSC071F07]